MGRQGKAAWITVVACLLIGWSVLVSLLWGGFSSSIFASAVWFMLINAGILVVVLPWCYWPRHGVRRRAILKAYRVGFAIPAAPCVAVFVGMVWRLRFADLGGGCWAGLTEFYLAMFALIGIGVSVVIGWIAGISCAKRWKRPTDRCERCGYNLTGNRSGVCPECGVEVHPI